MVCRDAILNGKVWMPLGGCLTHTLWDKREARWDKEGGGVSVEEVHQLSICLSLSVGPVVLNLENFYMLSFFPMVGCNKSVNECE